MAIFVDPHIAALTEQDEVVSNLLCILADITFYIYVTHVLLDPKILEHLDALSIYFHLVVWLARLGVDIVGQLIQDKLPKLVLA